MTVKEFMEMIWTSEKMFIVLPDGNTGFIESVRCKFGTDLEAMIEVCGELKPFSCEELFTGGAEIV